MLPIQQDDCLMALIKVDWRKLHGTQVGEDQQQALPLPQPMLVHVSQLQCVYEPVDCSVVCCTDLLHMHRHENNTTHQQSSDNDRFQVLFRE